MSVKELRITAITMQHALTLKEASLVHVPLVTVEMVLSAQVCCSYLTKVLW